VLLRRTPKEKRKHHRTLQKKLISAGLQKMGVVNLQEKKKKHRPKNKTTPIPFKPNIGSITRFHKRGKKGLTTGGKREKSPQRPRKEKDESRLISSARGQGLKAGKRQFSGKSFINGMGKDR